MNIAPTRAITAIGFLFIFAVEIDDFCGFCGRLSALTAHIVRRKIQSREGSI
jgi:hypothetical protein